MSHCDNFAVFMLILVQFMLEYDSLCIGKIICDTVNVSLFHFCNKVPLLEIPTQLIILCIYHFSWSPKEKNWFYTVEWLTQVSGIEYQKIDDCKTGKILWRKNQVW